MPIADDAANKNRVELIEDLRKCWWSSFCTRVIALLQVVDVIKTDIGLQFQQYACRLRQENDRLAGKHDRLVNGTDQEKLQLNQMDFQAQINSLRNPCRKHCNCF